MFRNPGSGKKGLFPAQKQTFRDLGKVSFRVRKERFGAGKVCVPAGFKCFRDRPGKLKFRNSSCKFPKLWFFEGRSGVSLFLQPWRNTALLAGKNAKRRRRSASLGTLYYDMFAKDATFHFILASHLQPVDQVDHPDHFEQNALQNEVGGVGEVEYSTPPRGNRAKGIPFRNRLCCYSGRLVAK